MPYRERDSKGGRARRRKREGKGKEEKEGEWRGDKGRKPLGDGPHPHTRAPERHKQNRILYYSIWPIFSLSFKKKEFSSEIKTF